MTLRTDLGSRSSVRQKVDVSQIFKISATELELLFDRNVGQAERLDALKNQHGGQKGILQKLQSRESAGIMGDMGDLTRRSIKFDKNEKPRVQKAKFFDSVKDALNDRILFIVAIMACISIIPGMVVSPKNGWVEGVFILVALFIQVLITAWSDLSKDQKFIDLQSLNREESLPVVRGKELELQTVSVWNLVVGDVVHLMPGDKVPADCLVLSSANLRVNEVMREDFDDGRPTNLQWRELVKDKDESPFLIADSYVLEGTCTALVCCVGKHSTRGVIDTLYDVSDQETELTRKLENIGGSLKFLSLLAAVIILATSLITLFLQMGVNKSQKTQIFIEKLVDNIVISFIILIVAIPEGLPMTVAVSLSHSVLLMNRHDDLLVRDVTSVETAGLITDICLGKTGTMTTEEMTVETFYTQSIYVKNSRNNSLLNCNLDDSIIEKLCESIIFNSSAYIEMDENSFYVPVGSGTEVSLIKWLQLADQPVHEIMAKKKDDIVLASIPFNSKLKRSITAILHPGMTDTVRVYVKGAPELVMEDCYFEFNEFCQKKELDQGQRNYILEDTMQARMTTQGLRCLAFSYVDMSLSQFEDIKAQTENFQRPNSERALLRNQIFLALIALRDPLRANLKDSLAYAPLAGINLRMISGDNVDTARRVAVDAGILTQEEAHAPGKEFVMLASDFRAITGDVLKIPDEVEEGDEETFTYRLNQVNQLEFNRIIDSLKVIGRAEPEDKLRLIAGLRGMREFEDDETSGRTVAIVGEGINDVPAFNAANISFAVQSGTSLARNNASMILQTNDFESCMKAIMWGRNIYLNVQRFLQFQITCNLALLVVVFVSYICLQDSALNAVQLIYVNLIMDVFGALALASTRPETDIANFQVASQSNIMTPFMYRQIIGVASYMVGIMMIVMFCGKSIFELSYEKSVSPLTKEGEPKQQHFTLIWSTFVFLQVFNLINSRDVGNKLHGFGGLQRNFLTYMIVLLIFSVQVVCGYTFLGGMIFGAAKLQTHDFAVTLFMGASVCLANMLLKFIPQRWLAKMPSLNENKAIGAESSLMAAYNKQANAKAFKSRPGSADLVDQEESFDANEDDYRGV